ncbi:MAG: hypothetical protein ABIJ92_02805 [Candidatus Aenigmatarchaeota archaeon]
MKLFTVMLLATVFMLLIQPSVQAVATPGSPTFIPGKEFIAPGSAFLLAVGHPGPGSVRIGWDIKYNPLCNFGRSGSIPKIGSNWLCYFSNTDSSATCGPSPFTGCAEGQSYTMGLSATDASGDSANTTNDMSIGHVTLDTQVIHDNGTITIRTCGIGATLSSAFYTIHRQSDLYQTKSSTPLNFESSTSCYTGTTALDPDEYYVAIEAVGNQGKGGDLKTLSVPDLSDPDPDPGTCPELSCEEDCPCDTPGPGPTGNAISSIFTPQSPTLGEGVTTWTYTNGRITNIDTTSYTNLSAVVPAGFSIPTNKMIITLSRTNFAPNETIFFTVRLENIQSSMDVDTQFELLSGATIIGYVPVDVKLSLIGSGTQTVYITSDTMGLDPEIITGNYLAGEETEKEITIKNNGDSVMTDFTKTTTGDLFGFDVEFPVSIPSGSTNTLTVKMNPTSPKNYNGKIIINSSVGPGTVYVNANFYGDITSSVNSKRADYADVLTLMPEAKQLILKDVLEDINRTLDTAITYHGNGDYAGAQRKYDEAVGQIDVLEATFAQATTPPPGPPPPVIPDDDPTGLIVMIGVLVLVILIGVGVWFFLKKKNMFKGKDGEYDTELDEEFEPPPK